MKHEMPSLPILRPTRRAFGLLMGLILAVAQGDPSPAAEARNTDDAAAKPGLECGNAQTAIERLICAEPSLVALDHSMAAALGDYRDRA